MMLSRNVGLFVDLDTYYGIIRSRCLFVWAPHNL